MFQPFTADAATLKTTEQAEPETDPEQAEPEAATEPEQTPTVRLAPPPVVRRHSKVSPTILHPEIPAGQRHNYHIHDDALGEGTPGEKFNRNIRAIRLLKKAGGGGPLRHFGGAGDFGPVRGLGRACELL